MRFLLKLFLPLLTALAASNLGVREEVQSAVSAALRGEGLVPREPLQGSPLRYLDTQGVGFKSIMSSYKLDLPHATNWLTKLINKLLEGRTIALPDQSFDANGVKGSAKNITCGKASIGDIEFILNRGAYYNLTLGAVDLLVECDLVIEVTKVPILPLTLPPSPARANSVNSNFTVGIRMGEDKYKLPINSTGSCGGSFGVSLWIDAPDWEKGLINIVISALVPTIEKQLEQGLCDGIGSFPGVVALIDDDLSPLLYNATHWVEENLGPILIEIRDLIKEIVHAAEELIDHLEDLLKKLEEEVIKRLENWIEKNTNSTARTEGAGDFPTGVKVALILFAAFVFLAFMYAGCRHHLKHKRASSSRQTDYRQMTN